jgi:serine/threonine-protein kinase
MNYEIGARVGDYEILAILGAGGMGRVYKVRNILSDRVEAMKVLLPDLAGNPGLADRFMREIKVQASLDHPNIAALYAALRLENQLIMLMEYIEGTTLEKMMEAAPVPIEKAADYMSQVLSALSYAHARGVVHRDLKPGNIMITPSGAVKLMDFGIAKMAADRKLTQTGSTVGSLYYMSPEQIKGVLDLDPRSDIYSLGVTLYEVVTGARPFQGDSEYSIMAAHLEKNPPPPIQVSPNLPAGLSEIIMQALEKDPARRFQTADAFRNALRHVFQPAPGPGIAAASAAKAAPQATIPPPAAARPRRGLWITIGALIVLAVLAVVAIQIPKFRQTAAEPAPAAGSETAPQPSEMIAPAGESRAPEAAAPAQGSAGAPATEAVPSARPESVLDLSALRKPAVRPASAGGGTQAPAQPPVTARPAPDRPMEAPAPSAEVPAVPPEDAAAAAQMEEIRKQLDLLNIRMDTIKAGLENLRRQQAASGLGLRADMANAAQRMEYYCGLAETALQKRDPQGAKKNLDLAEREASKLESFLGR